jgi:hypothetical protein
MAIRNARALLGVPSFLWAVDLGSRFGLIGLLTLDGNCAGARSAGNPPIRSMWRGLETSSLFDSEALPTEIESNG